MHMELYENGCLDTHVEGVNLLTVSYGTNGLFFFKCLFNNKHAISNSMSHVFLYLAFGQNGGLVFALYKHREMQQRIPQTCWFRLHENVFFQLVHANQGVPLFFSH